MKPFDTHARTIQITYSIFARAFAWLVAHMRVRFIPLIALITFTFIRCNAVSVDAEFLTNRLADTIAHVIAGVTNASIWRYAITINAHFATRLASVIRFSVLETWQAFASIRSDTHRPNTPVFAFGLANVSTADAALISWIASTSIRCRTESLYAAATANGSASSVS